MNKKKVALIEFYTWHSECLYSQLLFLNKSGYSTTLICDIRQKTQVEIHKLLINEIIYYDFKKFISLIKLYFLIQKRKIHCIIFNTAQGSIIWKFLLFPFSNKTKFLGILHNLKKLHNSFGQKIVSRKVKHYYLLASYLTKYFPLEKGLQCQAFSSAFMPEFTPQSLPEKYNDIWICIPGSIEYYRRDYVFLINVVQQKEFPQHIKFILLGNAQKGDGRFFIQKIIEMNLQKHFIWFNSFISNELFQSYLMASDFLLPLIHSFDRTSQDYIKNKVSGTFILSEAYGKTMLCDILFKEEEGFVYPSLFYSDITDFILLISYKLQSVASKKTDFEENRKKYIDFLEKCIE